jgi:SAM-dependent methyltransferase
MTIPSRLNMKSPISLHCLKHGSSLRLNESGSQYECISGCVFPVIGGIPRFVSNKNYALSFGVQWNAFRTVQLDSYTGTDISKDRLTRLMGGTLEHLKGKLVLEAGCGAGRFTEVLLDAGACVFAVDLSGAVEANYENCKRYKAYFVCQADIMALPVSPEQFDVVICIGVIQATPCPEKTIAALSSQVKPGGLLVLDHYSPEYPITPLRRLLRFFLVRRPGWFSLRVCRGLVKTLWPLHRFLWKYRNHCGIREWRSGFLSVSPVIDYQDAYPQLGSDFLRSWSILDLHDTVTDVYKHLRSAEEISNCLRECGMNCIETFYGGNGVEARARKPTQPVRPSTTLEP